MKVLIWIGCMVVPAFIFAALRANGITLGGIPTAAIFGAALFAASAFSKNYDQKQEAENTGKKNESKTDEKNNAKIGQTRLPSQAQTSAQGDSNELMINGTVSVPPSKVTTVPVFHAPKEKEGFLVTAKAEDPLPDVSFIGSLEKENTEMILQKPYLDSSDSVNNNASAIPDGESPDPSRVENTVYFIESGSSVNSIFIGSDTVGALCSLLDTEHYVFHGAVCSGISDEESRTEAYRKVYSADQYRFFLGHFYEAYEAAVLALKYRTNVQSLDFNSLDLFFKKENEMLDLMLLRKRIWIIPLETGDKSADAYKDLAVRIKKKLNEIYGPDLSLEKEDNDFITNIAAAYTENVR